MPTRKLKEPEVWVLARKRCKYPDHNPPGMRVFEPGFYEHTCPACGATQPFTVAERPQLGRPAGLRSSLGSLAATRAGTRP